VFERGCCADRMVSMSENEANPLDSLAAFCGNDLRKMEVIRTLFDCGFETHSDDRCWTLNGLVVLLQCLESLPDDGSTLTVPTLCRMQAMQAAYNLGLRDANRRGIKAKPFLMPAAPEPTV
jgi:hypothetical protein